MCGSGRICEVGEGVRDLCIELSKDLGRPRPTLLLLGPEYDVLREPAETS